MHKGQSGKPLLIVGSSQYHGAAILASQAALISGSDYVYVLTHGSKYNIISQSSPCIITSKYDNQENIVQQFQNINISSITIGCGLDRSEESYLMLLQSIQLQSIKNVPLTIDADGIFLLSKYIKNEDIKLNKNILLTPNSREFDLLYQSLFNKHSSYFTDNLIQQQNNNIIFDINKVKNDIIDLSNKLNCNILVKFIIDIATDGEKIYYTSSHGQPKRSSGQGDILSGIISCFVNNQTNICEKACTAAQLCKLGAINAYNKNYISITALDIIQGIKEEILKYKENQQQKFTIIL